MIRDEHTFNVTLRHWISTRSIPSHFPHFLQASLDTMPSPSACVRRRQAEGKVNSDGPGAWQPLIYLHSSADPSPPSPLGASSEPSPYSPMTIPIYAFMVLQHSQWQFQFTLLWCSNIPSDKTNGPHKHSAEQHAVSRPHQALTFSVVGLSQSVEVGYTREPKKGLHKPTRACAN